MNLYKKAWDNLIPFVIMTFVMYLIGSFIAVSFNPADWEEKLRIFMSLSSLAWGLALWFNFTVRGFYD